MLAVLGLFQYRSEFEGSVCCTPDSSMFCTLFGLGKDREAWGQFGDFFGGLLNPIIAACTLFVAMRVWALQEKELKDTRTELKSQRDHQYFFNLLNVYHEVVKGLPSPVSSADSVATANGTSSVTGKTVLENWRLTLESTNLKGESLDSPWCSLLDSGDTDALQKLWDSSEVSYLLSGYFGIIKSILTEVDALTKVDSKEPERIEEAVEKAKRLVAIFRHQLTHDELLLISYYNLLDAKGQLLKQIDTKYDLLQGLHPDRKVQFEKLLSENRNLFSTPPNVEKETTPC